VTNGVWSGYVLTPLQSRQFTSVSANWVEPAATCTKAEPSAWTLFWVGLDGWSSFDGQTVEQGGTSAQCVGDTKHPGHPVYQVWWEMYPANDVTTAFYITPGDQISASVVYSSVADTYTVTVTDSTSGQTLVVVCSTNAAAVDPNTYTVTVDGISSGLTSFTTSSNTSAVLCGYGNPCQNGSAEWVVEAPGGNPEPNGNGTLYPLAHFRPVTFSGANATDSAGDSGPIIDSSAWTTTAVDLTNFGNTHLASVTPLRKQATQFRDVWVSTG
jgi:hypothetical protein